MHGILVQGDIGAQNQPMGLVMARMDAKTPTFAEFGHGYVSREGQMINFPPQPLIAVQSKKICLQLQRPTVVCE